MKRIFILIVIVILVISRLFGPAIMDFVDGLLQTPTPTPQTWNLIEVANKILVMI